MKKDEAEHMIKMLSRLLEYNLAKAACLQAKGAGYESALLLLLNDQLMLQSLILLALRAYAGSDTDILAFLDRGTFEIELINLLATNYIKLPVQD